ncbi:hypothetical protein K439DRAFT_933564 [Ramaria rubella]|nr:hypothetical protein K439DRAFT_933564 [Ramaria rubella]
MYIEHISVGALHKTASRDAAWITQKEEEQLNPQIAVRPSIIRPELPAGGPPNSGAHSTPGPCGL